MSYVQPPSKKIQGRCLVSIPKIARSEYMFFSVENGYIYLTHPEWNRIPISSIDEMVNSSAGCCLKGSFYQKDQFIDEIHIIISNDKVRHTFIQDVGLLTESVQGRLIKGPGENTEQMEVEIKKSVTYSETMLEVKSLETKKSLLVLNTTKTLYQSGNILLAFDYIGSPYYIVFKGDSIPFDLSMFAINQNIYFHNSCLLNGSLGTEKMKNQQVSIFFKEEEILFIKDYYEIYKYYYDQLHICEQRGCELTLAVTSNDGNVSFINVALPPEGMDQILNLDHDTETDLIHIQNQPYQVTTKETGWVFVQSSNSYDKIPYSNIREIKVLRQPDENRCLLEIHCYSHQGLATAPIKHTAVTVAPMALQPLIGNSTIQLECAANQAQTLLRTQYRQCKSSLLSKATLNDLYTSWSRHINDVLLYNFFGDLVILQREIHSIQENEGLPSSTKREQLLHVLYYGMTEYNRSIDRVSIEFPEMVFHEDKSLLNQMPTEHYEQLQYRLLALTSQYRRHLVEVQSALRPLSSAIIPKPEIDDYNPHKKKSYGPALAWGGLGLATHGIGLSTGGLGYAAAAITAYKTYQSNRENEKKEQHQKLSDQLKTDFHLHQALDAFDHLVDTMLPYYVSQVSKSFYQTTKNNGPFILNGSITDLETRKQVIFNKLADAYALKHFPLDLQEDLYLNDILKSLMVTNQEEKQPLRKWRRNE
ncbi:hypothetical protein N780_09540 [Pontibacillus chungwhensis BH030062]|uniref:Uncharacterized protein n=1 Tax=Pontibacillus chungwhensis BH030062 TaxID=1385513 RepID=A0A0A2UNQ2_9BACI|nr:hypothetical protein [Pontibacillus chungwhensis]KGP89877.1 hypothetical protein N780_09540 [Pontibacillus chungwhensis BH030062]